MPTLIEQLHGLGQSVWCDNLSRSLVRDGELRRLIGLGVVGVTSNPTIFMKSISGGRDYDQQIAALSRDARDVVDTYEQLAIADVGEAADVLRETWDRSGGVDGYVSLEVNPHLAHDTGGTIAEARRLFAALDRPNVMIKVPATPEGIPAIEMLIGDGINVNVTLIFALRVYEQVMQAYLRGLRRLEATGGSLSRVASVASFFVSRVDTLVDQVLAERKLRGASVDALLGRAAVANAQLAYARFQQVFDEKGEFGAMASRGARVQRPLWASTSCKNPAYSDTIYVDNLVGPNTVNTMPPQTLDATLDHGRAAVTITQNLDAASRVFMQLANVDVDMDSVTAHLLRDGVRLFAESFESLLANLAQKRDALRNATAEASA